MKQPSYKLFTIFRYNPDKDIKPHYEKYVIDLNE